MNKITLIGYLGQDPEMGSTHGGTTTCRFSIADNRRRTNSEGEQVEQTQWFRCTAYGRLAENIEAYSGKGQQIYVEGRLTGREFERNDGSTGYSLDVDVTDVQFLSSRNTEREEPAGDEDDGYDVPNDDAAPEDADDADMEMDADDDIDDDV